MHQPIKWWTGLIPLAALWAGGTALKTEGIENDLAEKARAAISALPGDALDSPVVSVAGRDIRVSGTGFTPDSAVKAATAVDAAVGVRLANTELNPPATARPYLFSVKGTANQLALEGFTPLPSVRAQIGAAARAAAPGALISDAMKYATGAPPQFSSAAAYAIGEASKLTNGAASISDGAYSISGEAATPAIYEASIAATRQLPA